MADSLYPFFGHDNPRYRGDAVQAFGSLQDTAAVERIGSLLLAEDVASVRRDAAFALGQIGHPAAEPIIIKALDQEESAAVTAELLEAYGKTTRDWNIDPSVFLDDSTTAAGVAWSLYRAGLRGKANTSINDIAIRLLEPTQPRGARLGAAHFFARGARGLRAAEKALITAARDDSHADVRMAAALALGKLPSDSTLTALKEIISRDRDTRVVTNALRALRAFPYPQIKHHLYEALSSKDVNVAITASEVIVAMVRPDDWIEVSSLTGQVANWRVKANLYEAALKAGQHAGVAGEIRSEVATAADPWQKAAYLGSLKHFPEAYDFVLKELRDADTAVVRSAAAATLLAMNRSERFTPRFRTLFAALFRELMEDENDPAVLGTVAMALGDSTLGYRPLITDASFLYEARKKLKLPGHHESLQSIESAIAYFEGQGRSSTVVNRFNHPINWDLVKQIPSEQRATIRTTRGTIIIQLLVNEAPGSVANFIALAEKDYFDNKTVHRVVPNFVVQDGCKRGDGWGSEDYSIRSEFSDRRYRTGSVGMASSGKDTEGTQWFITHSPTPHLDGRYTIFAEVTEGQRVVDFLQVGDRILDIEVEDSGSE